MVVIVVIVVMDMDDVPRFDLARDNMPAFKLAQAGGLSKGNLVQRCAFLGGFKNEAGTGEAGLGLLQFRNVQQS